MVSEVNDLEALLDDDDKHHKVRVRTRTDNKIVSLEEAAERGIDLYL
jgi:hypothetical protein